MPSKKKTQTRGKKYTRRATRKVTRKATRKIHSQKTKRGTTSIKKHKQQGRFEHLKSLWDEKGTLVIKLSGGPDKQHFANFKNKGEVVEMLRNKTSRPFRVAEGGADVIIIPNGVHFSSKTALSRSAYATVLKLNDFLDFLTFC